MNQKEMEAASAGMRISTRAIRKTMPLAVQFVTTSLDVATPTLVYAIDAQGGRSCQKAMRKRLAALGMDIGTGRQGEFITEYLIDQVYIMQMHDFLNEIGMMIDRDGINGIAVHSAITDPNGVQWAIGIAMDRGDPKPTALKARIPTRAEDASIWE